MVNFILEEYGRHSVIKGNKDLMNKWLNKKAGAKVKIAISKLCV